MRLDSIVHVVNFTSEGWKDFMKHMEGLLDQSGAPTFTSGFDNTQDAILLGEKDGVLHLRIPGSLTQSNKAGKTTYRRVAIEIYALR